MQNNREQILNILAIIMLIRLVVKRPHLQCRCIDLVKKSEVELVDFVTVCNLEIKHLI